MTASQKARLDNNPKGTVSASKKHNLEWFSRPDVPRTAENWIGVLQGVINGFDGTRHTITNHRFSRDGECVVCRAYLTAEHVIFSQPDIPVAAADEIATVVGEYTNTYRPTAEGWKICRSQLDIDWSAGNAELFAVAMGRAANTA